MFFFTLATSQLRTLIYDRRLMPMFVTPYVDQGLRYNLVYVHYHMR